MKPRICLIRSNGVCPDSRVEKEAACLVEAGFPVIILAWDRDSNHSASKETIQTFGMEIPIVRFGFKAEFGAGMKSLKPYLQFQYSVYRWLKKNKTHYDIIHACDFDTAFTSFVFRLFNGKKMVFDQFDFLYCIPQNIPQRIIRWIQHRITDSADATIICTEERQQQIAGTSPRKLVVIHNTPPKVTITAEKAVPGDKVKVCYVGILQDHRLLQEIPTYFKEHPEVELHIGGFGKFETIYKELSEKYPNIKFYGRLQYDQTLKLESACDIMLAIYAPYVDNHIYAAPNKFYESLMLAKPVVMVKGTGMSSVVKDTDIGVTIDYSLKGFSDGIDALIQRKVEWSSMGKRMTELYDKNYSWDEMKKRLIGLYNSLS